MLLKKICLYVFCLSTMMYAEQIIINDGKTYQFAEKNAIDDIKEHIEKNKEQIQAKIDKSKKEQLEKSKNWKPEQNKLSVAKQDKIFYPDMTYVLQDDIKDANGRVIYKKGYKFNPGDYTYLQQELLVLNGDSKDEMSWATKNKYFESPKYMILLSDGNAFRLAQKTRRPIYYLTKEISERFQIKKTPSIIKQIKNQIQVSEICLKNCQ